MPRLPRPCTHPAARVPHGRLQYLTCLPVLLCLAFTAGCSSTRIRKEPLPVTIEQPLAVGKDECIEVVLDWIIVRDGPGSWVKKANWDEYLLRIANISGEPVGIESVTVTDSLQFLHASDSNRKRLIKASKVSADNYGDEGIKVRAGSGAGLITAGIVGVGVAVTAAPAAIYMSSAAAGAAVGALLIGPVLIVGGVMKGINNSRVSDVIAEKNSVLPTRLEPQQTLPLDLFYSITPGPRLLTVTYSDSQGQHQLDLTLPAELAGLHLPENEPATDETVQ